jgi:hypothetical protein
MTTADEWTADDSLVKGIAGSQFLIHILFAKTLRAIKSARRLKSVSL